VFLRIHLQHNRLSRHFFRQRVDLRCSHATRPAPRCPEIDQDRDARALCDFPKQRRVGFKWFAYGRKRRLTRAAPSRLGEVFCRYPVLCPAGRACACEHGITTAGITGRPAVRAPLRGRTPRLSGTYFTARMSAVASDLHGVFRVFAIGAAVLAVGGGPAATARMRTFVFTMVSHVQPPSGKPAFYAPVPECGARYFTRLAHFSIDVRSVTSTHRRQAPSHAITRNPT
jgi:hypothetical protein